MPHRVGAIGDAQDFVARAKVPSDARIAADARRFDDHEDDLGVDTIVRILRDDLARRGTVVDEPIDPFTDPEWSRALTRTCIAPV